MRVDLDELDRLDYANCKACVCMGGCSDLLEAIPDLIAELRAARECARVLRCAYEVDAIKDWFDDVPGGAGGKASLEAYKRATKGDG